MNQSRELELFQALGLTGQTDDTGTDDGLRDRCNRGDARAAEATGQWEEDLTQEAVEDDDPGL